MRRKLILVPSLMLLCLVFVPDQVPEVRSQTASPIAEFIDDGVSLPDEPAFARLAATDPTMFLEMCMRRYRREVRTVSGEMHKQERIEGKLYPEETIDFWFREEPYSVLIKWKKGARQACASMYVEGENDNKVIALPTLLKWSGKVLERDPNCREAKLSSRYTLNESSLLQGTARTWQAWKAARDAGALHVEYKGVVAVPELDGRKCYVLNRTCEIPEGDGVKTVEIAVDAETWLQTGSTLKDSQGNLIGKYMFPQVVVNPTFSPTLFTKDSVRK